MGNPEKGKKENKKATEYREQFTCQNRKCDNISRFNMSI
jgi:hypothetical protein